MFKLFVIHEVYDKEIDWSLASDKEICERKIVGTKLTYEDSAGTEYSASFTGPNHKERVKAYGNLLYAHQLQPTEYVLPEPEAELTPEQDEWIRDCLPADFKFPAKVKPPEMNIKGKIPADIVEAYTAKAVGIRFFGHAIQELTREELIACLVCLTRHTASALDEAPDKQSP